MEPRKDEAVGPISEDDWARLERIMADGESVTGPVIDVVERGLIVDIGVHAFLPRRLVELKEHAVDLESFVGETIEATVTGIHKDQNKVVLSRRAFLKVSQADQIQAFLSRLVPGAIHQGVVSSVVNCGAFVDLGLLEGLVPRSELSRRHVSHPGEILSVGDQVTVNVLEVDRDRHRITLSMRRSRTRRRFWMR